MAGLIMRPEFDHGTREPCPHCNGTGYRTKPPPPGSRGGQRRSGRRHGYESTYSVGCRCDLCRAAHREGVNRRKARKGEMIMALTGANLETMLRAAGASPTGLVASSSKIADLFNDAIMKYGDGLFTTTNRVAALLSECMVESAWYRTTQEYKNQYQGAYAPYIGRGFIQCTWRANYLAFGKWCKAKKLINDGSYFVNNPTRLADLQWAALTGVWYFTHVNFSGKPLVDYADNIKQVGRAVNNGNPFSSYAARNEAERTKAYNAVRSLGSKIVPTTSKPPSAAVSKIDIFPTRGTIGTPFGRWGPSWSWNRNNGQGQHGGDDWHRNAGLAEIGDPIYAVADGRVIYAGNGGGWGPAFGNHVLVTWDNKQAGETVARTVIDAHMNKIAAKAGQHVSAGDLIGYKGMTGNVSGPHDHHEHHLGTRWTDKRVKPVYPGKTSTKIIEQEELDMADRIKFARGTSQKIKKPKQFQLLRLDKAGHVSFAGWGKKPIGQGPGKFVGGMIFLRISGMKPTDSFYLYQAAYDCKAGGKSPKQRGTSKANQLRIVGNQTGWVHVAVPWDAVIGKHATGYSFRALRFLWSATNPKTKIERVATSAWYIR